jgi:hypothetical protein
LKANAAALSYMANVIYDFDLHSRWTPHLGLGFGATNVRVSNVGHVSPFAAHALAGVEYAIAPNLRLGVDYKFLGTDKLTLTNRGQNLQSRANYLDHAVILSLRLKFGGSHPSPPPTAVMPEAVAAPPPPPAPAPAPRPLYIVYFETNSATLALDAREIVRRAASGAQRDAVRILVTGHTGHGRRRAL